jgi:molybdopterin/thiamine biosynthesis adenylyltransferase/rhodanese-related sulfurtransferase
MSTGQTIEREVQLTQEELRRYGRHLIMPEVGMEGQKKLKLSSVLLVGVGGLGSPVALYLAAAGIGRMGLVDFDTVDHSNLQRQIIHSTRSLGSSKLSSAKSSIQSINPNIEVELHEIRLTSENAINIIKGYDVIIDGTDNFPTRYLINDACVLLGKPDVYGSIFRFEGQVTVFDAKRGPCYRCLYAEPPPPNLVPNCAEGGVLGVLPGIIGTLQATEALKLLLGIGDSLVGRLLLVDALTMQFRRLSLQKDPNCPICGPNRTIHELIDYEAFCGVGGPADVEEMVNGDEINVQQLHRLQREGRAITLLDVRQPYERQLANIEGMFIPLNELEHRFREIGADQEIVVYCHSGFRSARAVEFLKRQGYRHVKNLRGGIDAWSVEIDPSVPRY